MMTRRLLSAPHAARGPRYPLWRPFSSLADWPAGGLPVLPPPLAQDRIWCPTRCMSRSYHPRQPPYLPASFLHSAPLPLLLRLL